MSFELSSENVFDEITYLGMRQLFRYILGKFPKIIIFDLQAISGSEKMDNIIGFNTYGISRGR